MDKRIRQTNRTVLVLLLLLGFFAGSLKAVEISPVGKSEISSSQGAQTVTDIKGKKTVQGRYYLDCNRRDRHGYYQLTRHRQR